jgi:tRNA(adenine34) deaminase
VEINHHKWIQQALALAREAELLGEVPIGAVLVKNGEVIGRGMNRTITDCDPTAHAEIVALRDAASTIGNYRLVDTQMYVTLEPCTMCAGALIHARVASLIFGASEPKAGAIVSSARVLDNESLNHQIEIIENVCRDECSELMSEFFRKKREARVK